MASNSISQIPRIISIRSTADAVPEGVDPYEYYVQVAKTRWLHTDEVYKILCNYEKMPIALSETAPKAPLPGDLYLFDRRVIKFFRKDGVKYIKRKGHSTSIKEEYSTLKIKGLKKLGVSYARSQVIIDSKKNLCRRVFKRIDVANVPPITLVQYFVNPIKKQNKERSTMPQNQYPQKKKLESATSLTSPNGRLSTTSTPSGNGAVTIDSFINDPFLGNGMEPNKLYGASAMAFESDKTIESMDLEWDVGDFSFADDEGNNPLDGSGSSDTPLYYSIVDFSPEEVFMNGNPKVSDRYRKKELKMIVVVRLLEGNDESLDLFHRKDDLQIAIEYGTRANTWVDMLPLHALSINTYRVLISYEMLHKYVGKQAPESVLESDVHIFDLKLYLMRKKSNRTTQSECIACSDKFILKVHYSNYKTKAEPRTSKKKREREKEVALPIDKGKTFPDVSTGALSTRQLKVRVIESMTRLSSVNSQGDNIFDQLDSLNDEQLHQMTENMVKQVVNQLSDIADKSVDCHLRKELLAIDENGYSLLHILCINNSPSSIATVLKVIQKDGTNVVVSAVNTPSKHGLFPLHIAALNGYEDCARELIQAGGSPKCTRSKRLHSPRCSFKSWTCKLCEDDQRNAST